MNKYSLVLLFSLFLFGCRSTKELNVSGFRIDLPFDKISLEPINDFGIFNYESEMKETMDNEVAIRPHYQIFIPMKGLKKIVETSTDWYFFYTHDRVIAIQQDLTKNYKTSERIKSSDGLGIRRISEDSVYYYSFSSECNKKLKNKGLPHYSYVDGEIIILMLNIPDRDYKYFVEYPLNSFRIKRRGGVRHRHDVPLICIMPPQPPDDETIIEQPMPDDQLIEDEVPCDVTAIDYCGNFFYEDGTLRRILIPGGYVTFANNNVNQPEYHFYITDHQWNVRVVANQNGEVEQVNHYYPYGGLMGESTSSDAQPYKYNGKELDRHHGLDWYDYGARWYNGLSWMTPDPLAEKYYDTSPYVYCLGNPVKYVDPDGRTGDIVYNQDGTAFVYAKLFFYGNAANTDLSKKIATGISSQWNSAQATINYKNKSYKVVFKISYETVSVKDAKTLIKNNTSARNNFIRVEKGDSNESSFTITNRLTGGGNSFWFNTKDELENSTTPAHEFGHGLGLAHPKDDLRGSATKPDIMVPRNTPYGSKWSLKDVNGKKVVNPNSRQVTKQNVEDAYWNNWGNYSNNKSVNKFINEDGTY